MKGDSKPYGPGIPVPWEVRDAQAQLGVYVTHWRMP